MKMRNMIVIGGLVLASAAGVHAQGLELLRDNFTTTNSTYATNLTGFPLNAGVNSGINPPTTRLTGPLAPNLRYIQRDAAKTNTAWRISSNKMFVAESANAGRATLSANGTTPFNFAPALGLAGAKPSDPAIYEVSINMDNDSNNGQGTQRMSFAISDTDGVNTVWDFGFQIFKPNSAATNYSVAHRVDALSSSTGGDVTSTLTTNLGTFGAEITIRMRVTDAGAETGAELTNYNSVIELFLGNSATPFYSTATDSTIGNKFRFDKPGRLLLWDVAPNATARYDSLVVKTVYAPAIPGIVWSGGGADDLWSSGANWNGSAPNSGTALYFSGTSRQANVNDLVDMTTPWLTFNNGGFNLSGNSLDVSAAITNLAGVNTVGLGLTFSSEAGKFWGIANGSELVLNSATSVEVIGDHEMYGGGILRQKAPVNIGAATTVGPAFIVNEGQHIIEGTTFISQGGYRVGSFPAGTGAKTVLTNGATMALNAATGNLRVGDSANPQTAVLDMNNSSVTFAGGALSVSYATGATGLVAQVGGSISGGLVIFNDNGVGSGTYTVQNGTLEPLAIREDNAAGFSSIYFNNAFLRTASGANSNFFSGLDIAEIQAGGLTMDITTPVAVSQPLSGSGNLTKTGSSKVVLTGANTYTGNTLVQAGQLYLPTVQTNATGVQVSSGAQLGANVRTPGSTLSISSLSFQGGSLNIDLGVHSTPTAPVMKVPSLSVSGPVTVNIENGFLLTPGQFVLVDYDGAISGGFQFTLGALPIEVSAQLVHNTANTSIDLLITGVPGRRWSGSIDGSWDSSTLNWLSASGSSTAYSELIPADFLDGAARGNVTLNINPSSPLITVSNNTLPYVWSGAAITTPKLKKFGSSSLTRNGGEGDQIPSIELNAGSYVANPGGSFNFTSVLTDVQGGTGTFVKAGAAELTIASINSTYDGAVVVQEGTLKLGTNSALGSTAGGTTIASGATLDLNDIVAPHEVVVVSGAGVSGLGAIVDTTTGGGVANNLTDVTLVGDTTFGSSGRWDLRVRTGTGIGPGLRGNGFNLTKVGTGSVSIACQRHFSVGQPYWEMNLGDVFINEGSLTFAESLTLGNPAKTITVAVGATLGTYDLNYTNPIVRTVSMTDSMITGSGGSATDTNAFAGTIQVNGTATLRGIDSKLVFDGPVVGPGAVTVTGTGAGVVYLNAVNTYAGETTLNTGSLGGKGTIPGNYTVVAGTTAPGMGIGTLTVNGSATLAGITSMELDRSKSPNSDRLVVNGTLNWGGVLTVVLGAGAPSPQAGDVYQLFNKAGTGSFASVNLPDLSALPGGLAWDISNLTVNGSITVTGTATPTTIGTVGISGGNFQFSGTGGVEGQTYTVLSSTNVTLPVASWTPVATNVFGPGGSFSYSAPVGAAPASFFTLRAP